MLNIPAMTLIARAYSSAPVDMVGLPDWARTERYDLNATASLSNPTPEQRAAMLRAMLEARFKLVAHIENRQTPVYDLVLARKDGQLGPAIKPSEADCIAKAAADRAALEPPANQPHHRPACSTATRRHRHVQCAWTVIAWKGTRRWKTWRDCCGQERADLSSTRQIWLAAIA